MQKVSPVAVGSLRSIPEGEELQETGFQESEEVNCFCCCLWSQKPESKARSLDDELVIRRTVSFSKASSEDVEVERQIQKIKAVILGDF